MPTVEPMYVLDSGPDWTGEQLVVEVRRLRAEREQLALAICGGEDAPGYANAQSVETLVDIARQNSREWFNAIDRALDAEAEVERLKTALKDAIGTLAASRHLLRIYKPDHYWLPKHDERIRDLRAVISKPEGRTP